MSRQMEKLIELLNEYGKEYGWVLFKRDMKIVRMDVHTLEWTSKNSDLIIISKKFGFIKWLVENDKIDVKELEKSDRPFDVGYATEETLYERVLMLLSIQDEPIQFLVSILKDDATEKIDTLLKGVKKSCESLGI